MHGFITLPDATSYDKKIYLSLLQIVEIFFFRWLTAYFQKENPKTKESVWCGLIQIFDKATSVKAIYKQSSGAGIQAMSLPRP